MSYEKAVRETFKNNAQNFSDACKKMGWSGRIDQAVFSKDGKMTWREVNVQNPQKECYAGIVELVEKEEAKIIKAFKSTKGMKKHIIK